MIKTILIGGMTVFVAGFLAAPAEAACRNNFTPRHGETITFKVGQNFCRETRSHDRAPAQTRMHGTRSDFNRTMTRPIKSAIRPTSSGFKQVGSGVKGIVRGVGSIGKGAIDIAEDITVGVLDIVF